MIDVADTAPELDVEEQASVLLDVISAALGEALSQGVELDLGLLEGLSLDAAGEGDIKLVLKHAGKDPVEVVVPSDVVMEALGEVGMEESPEEEASEGEVQDL